MEAVLVSLRGKCSFAFFYFRYLRIQIIFRAANSKEDILIVIVTMMIMVVGIIFKWESCIFIVMDI